MKRIVFAGIILTFLFSISAIAQTPKIRASQKASLTQTIATTKIAIEYSRPVAKGRVLFGPKGIVKYKKIWMPGANKSTTIEFGTDVLVEGKPVSAAKYSVWAIPGSEKWIFMLSKDWDQWHTDYPGEKDDALRFEVKPETGAHMEALAFYFPEVKANSAWLRLHWGSTILPIEIKTN